LEGTLDALLELFQDRGPFGLGFGDHLPERVEGSPFPVEFLFQFVQLYMGGLFFLLNRGNQGSLDVLPFLGQEIIQLLLDLQDDGSNLRRGLRTLRHALSP